MNQQTRDSLATVVLLIGLAIIAFIILNAVSGSNWTSRGPTDQVKRVGQPAAPSKTPQATERAVASLSPQNASPINVEYDYKVQQWSDRFGREFKALSRYIITGSITNPHNVSYSHVAATIRFGSHGNHVYAINVETDYLGPRETWRFVEVVDASDPTVPTLIAYEAEVVRVVTKP